MQLKNAFTRKEREKFISSYFLNLYLKALAVSANFRIS